VKCKHIYSFLKSSLSIQSISAFYDTHLHGLAHTIFNVPFTVITGFLELRYLFYTNNWLGEVCSTCSMRVITLLWTREAWEHSFSTVFYSFTLHPVKYMLSEGEQMCLFLYFKDILPCMKHIYNSRHLDVHNGFHTLFNLLFTVIKDYLDLRYLFYTNWLGEEFSTHSTQVLITYSHFLRITHVFM